jgi:hypothetical protein
MTVRRTTDFLVPLASALLLFVVLGLDDCLRLAGAVIQAITRRRPPVADPSPP